MCEVKFRYGLIAEKIFWMDVMLSTCLKLKKLLAVYEYFRAVKNLLSCIQLYGTLLDSSRVPYPINKLHGIKLVHRLAYYPAF